MAVASRCDLIPFYGFYCHLCFADIPAVDLQDTMNPFAAGLGFAIPGMVKRSYLVGRITPLNSWARDFGCRSLR